MKRAIPLDEEEVLEKLRKYCAWQERCRAEAEVKLLALGSPGADVPRLLSVLESEGFLDEGRYARAYAREKFSQHGWGRIKIREALREKEVLETQIDAALELIEDDEYGERLMGMIRKRLGSHPLDDWEAEQKLRGYLAGKGYEADEIDKAMGRFETRAGEDGAS
ncbi:MAG: hypothetical protein RLZZ165_1657 [Bacteroidota bacterium]|jgi:regulatory protein